MEIKKIIEKFSIEGNVINVELYGHGHINTTYKVDIQDSEDSYILQKINTSIFKNYDGMMNNIYKVTTFLRDDILKNGGDIKREVMTIIPTKDNGLYYLDEDKNCYRMYLFIQNSKVYQLAESKEIFENSGRAFGKFMADLDSFDATELVEVIPDFHNTPKRYNNFLSAVKLNKANRLNSVNAEAKFFQDRKNFYPIITEALNCGKIPVRVTHNDTKLNNILLDADTEKALCVIDLDTIMPGSSLYDFGDSVRFGCSTALEDEKDLTKVHFDIDLYNCYLRGYVDGAGDKITEDEVKMLHIGAMMMTLECGMRFLTDYLEGDTYFKTAYAEHNLVRARTQIALVKEMEQNAEKMLAMAIAMINN